MNTPVSSNDKKTQSNHGFGGRLRHARNNKGLSLESIAKELNILKRYLQAFEEENFENLPQFVYARGFLVNYAKFLDLDADELALAFDNAYPNHLRKQEVTSPLTPMDTVVRGHSGLRINPWLVAGVIGLVLLGFILLKIINNATSKNNEPSFEDDVQVLTPIEQAQGAAIGGSGSAIGSDGVPAVGTGVVDIWSKGDVSIKITDRHGNILMQGVQSRGGYQLKGETPMMVEIDNPAQVDINFNYKPIRLGEHTKDGKATLTLQ